MRHRVVTKGMLQREIEAEEAALPPLQSVVELTSAHLSPAQQAAELEATGGTQGADELRHESAAGHLLEDGEGVLADGSTWRRVSGEEKDDNGYWCRCGPSLVRIASAAASFARRASTRLAAGGGL